MSLLHIHGIRNHAAHKSTQMKICATFFIIEAYIFSPNGLDFASEGQERGHVIVTSQIIKQVRHLAMFILMASFVKDFQHHLRVRSSPW